MEVPLLQRRNQAFLTQYPQRGVFSANATGLTLIPSLKDAVRITISDEAKARAKAASEGEESTGDSTLSKGFGELAIERLSELSQKMKEVSSQIETELGSSNKEALQGELSILKAEYENIRQSPELKRFLEITSLVRSTLAAGTSPDVLERSLRSESGLLGERFINAVRGGGGSLGIIESSLASLVSTSLSELDSKDTSVLSKIVSDVKSIKEALNGPVVSNGVIAQPVIESSVPQPIIINPDETQYVVGSNLALTVKNFGGKNLIAMAVGVEGLDANDLFQLEIKAPKKEDDEEKKDKEQNPLKPEPEP